MSMDSLSCRTLWIARSVGGSTGRAVMPPVPPIPVPKPEPAPPQEPPVGEPPEPQVRWPS